jgi:membrane associated rhomboid family serine protease
MQKKPLIVNVIIALNAVVFFLWYSSKVPQNAFMADNFLVSWTGLQEGRYWTLLTSVFSHNMLWHLLINMFVLRSFGGIIELVAGRKFFILFYLFAGIFSSLCHCLVSAFLLNRPELPALGASGAIAGLVLLFSLMFPKEKILLLGIIPLPALFGALIFIALDVWGLVAQAEGGGLPIGHGAHLGGSLAGILSYFFIIRKRMRRAREAKSRSPIS